MKEKLLPWENPNQDYRRTLIKRHSERRYRTLQMAKTLRIMLTKFKTLNIERYNSEIITKISFLEGNSDVLDDEDFSEAKKFVSKMKRNLTKAEKEKEQK
ncbi:MAG: hypothetical protein ACI31W_06165 [Lactococcus sp.]